MSGVTSNYDKSNSNYQLQKASGASGASGNINIDNTASKLNAIINKFTGGNLTYTDAVAQLEKLNGVLIKEQIVGDVVTIKFKYNEQEYEMSCVNKAQADGKDDIKVKTLLMSTDQFSKLDEDVQKYFVQVGQSVGSNMMRLAYNDSEWPQGVEKSLSAIKKYVTEQAPNNSRALRDGFRDEDEPTVATQPTAATGTPVAEQPAVEGTQTVEGAQAVKGTNSIDGPNKVMAQTGITTANITVVDVDEMIETWTDKYITGSHADSNAKGILKDLYNIGQNGYDKNAYVAPISYDNRHAADDGGLTPMVGTASDLSAVFEAHVELILSELIDLTPNIPDGGGYVPNDAYRVKRNEVIKNIMSDVADGGPIDYNKLVKYFMDYQMPYTSNLFGTTFNSFAEELNAFYSEPVNGKIMNLPYNGNNLDIYDVPISERDNLEIDGTLTVETRKEELISFDLWWLHKTNTTGEIWTTYSGYNAPFFRLTIDQNNNIKITDNSIKAVQKFFTQKQSREDVESGIANKIGLYEAEAFMSITGITYNDDYDTIKEKLSAFYGTLDGAFLDNNGNYSVPFSSYYTFISDSLDNNPAFSNYKSINDTMADSIGPNDHGFILYSTSRDQSYVDYYNKNPWNKTTYSRGTQAPYRGPRIQVPKNYAEKYRDTTGADKMTYGSENVRPGTWVEKLYNESPALPTLKADESEGTNSRAANFYDDEDELTVATQPTAATGTPVAEQPTVEETQTVEGAQAIEGANSIGGPKKVAVQTCVTTANITVVDVDEMIDEWTSKYITGSDNRYPGILTDLYNIGQNGYGTNAYRAPIGQWYQTTKRNQNFKDGTGSDMSAVFEAHVTLIIDKLVDLPESAEDTDEYRLKRNEVIKNIISDVADGGPIDYNKLVKYFMDYQMPYTSTVFGKTFNSFAEELNEFYSEPINGKIMNIPFNGDNYAIYDVPLKEMSNKLLDGGTITQEEKEEALIARGIGWLQRHNMNGYVYSVDNGYYAPFFRITLDQNNNIKITDDSIKAVQLFFTAKDDREDSKNGIIRKNGEIVSQRDWNINTDGYKRAEAFLHMTGITYDDDYDTIKEKLSAFYGTLDGAFQNSDGTYSVPFASYYKYIADSMDTDPYFKKLSNPLSCGIKGDVIDVYRSSTTAEYIINNNVDAKRTAENHNNKYENAYSGPYVKVPKEVRDMAGADKNAIGGYFVESLFNESPALPTLKAGESEGANSRTVNQDEPAVTEVTVSEEEIAKAEVIMTSEEFKTKQDELAKAIYVPEGSKLIYNSVQGIYTMTDSSGFKINYVLDPESNKLVRYQDAEFKSTAEESRQAVLNKIKMILAAIRQGLHYTSNPKICKDSKGNTYVYDETSGTFKKQG